MSRALKNKLIAVFMTLFLSCTALSVGMMVSRANTPITLSDVNLTLSEAEVMIDGEDGKDGLKFNANLSASDYEQLIAIVGENKTYVSMETGVVIAPNYYNVETPIERYSLFGAGATYDYATWNGSSYVYNGDKIRVININANDWVKDGENYVYSGAIVDILPANVSEEFFAIAYIKVVDALGGEEYKFSSSSVTSMAYATQVAIEDGVLTGSKASYAQAHFVDVVNEKFTFTTEYYVRTPNGYELKESVVSNDTYLLDTEVEANIKDYSAENLELDEDASSVLTGKVKANDKLTLKVYYRDSVAQVIGFNTASSVVVTTGTKVVLEKPEPVDQNGTKLEVFFDVMNKDGGYVETFNDGENEYFYAGNEDYVITYAVYPYDKVVTLKTTSVTVVASATVNVEYDKIVETGKEISINATSGFYAPNFTYSVIKDADSSSVTVTDGKFTLSDTGYYTVTVKADSLGKEAETSYKVYARQPIQKGEIEVFSEGWEEIRKINGYPTKGWTITDSATSLIKDRNGDDGVFAKYSVSASESAPMYWLDALSDVETYRALVDEGYTRVAMYVYIDGENQHGVTFMTDSISSSVFNIDKGNLIPNTWNKVEVNLLETANVDCRERSFISGYPVWANGENGILRFSNGSGNAFNIYIDDIFAIKKQTITNVDNVMTECQVGDIVDLDTLVAPIDGVDFKYYVQNNTAKEDMAKIEGSSYMFKSCGVYTIKVLPQRGDISGELTFNLNVTDNITMDQTWQKVKMTGDSITVDLKNYVVLRDGGTPIDYTLTTYYHDDYALTMDGTSVTIDKAGYYKVYIEGTYGNGYKTYKQFDLDVYTDKDQYVMARVEDYIVTRFFGYTDLPGYTVGEQTIYDVTDNMLKLSGVNAAVVLFRPMYSKAYYEDMIAGNNTAKARLWFAAKSTNGTNKVYARYIPKHSQVAYLDTYYEDRIDVDYIVENYDTYANAFARELKVVQNGGYPMNAYGDVRKDYLFLSNDYTKNSIYIRDFIIEPGYTDETVNLIDANKITSYDALDSVKEEGKAVIAAYDASDITYKLTDNLGNTIDGHVVDLTSDDNVRMWKLEAIVNGLAAYTGYVDFYRGNAVWNNSLSRENFKIATGTTKYANMSTINIEDKTIDGEKYIAIDGSKAANRGITLLPIHSKEYYQMYAQSGIDYTLSFKAGKYAKEGTTGVDGGGQMYFLSTTNVYLPLNGVKEANLTLEYLIEKWDHVINPVENYLGWGSRGLLGMVFLIDADSATSVNHQYYFGAVNFVGVSKDDTVYLTDVKDEISSSFDITTKLGEKADAVLSGYTDGQLSYRLTDNLGNVSDGKILDLTKAENVKQWMVEAIYNNAVIYQGHVDLYDSSADFVWQVGSATVWTRHSQSGSSVIEKESGSSSSLSRDGSPVNTSHFVSSVYGTGGEHYFVAKPSHSKAYYDLFLGKGYKLNFAIYFDNDAVEGKPAFAQLYKAGSGTSTIKTDANIKGWVDVSISLDTLINKWSFVDCSGSYAWGTRRNFGMIHIYNSKNITTINRGIHFGSITITNA